MKKVLILLIFAVIFVITVKSQDLDSSDTPIAKKVGVVIFPFEKKIGLSYCFGKKGQFKIENNLEPSFRSKPFRASIFLNETRILYAWKSCGHKKLYSGGGIEISQNNGEVFVFSTSIVPIGIEWFPLKRLRRLGVIVETNLYLPITFKYGVDGRIGLSYYF